MAWANGLEVGAKRFNPVHRARSSLGLDVMGVGLVDTLIVLGGVAGPAAARWYCFHATNVLGCTPSAVFEHKLLWMTLVCISRMAT